MSLDDARRIGETVRQLFFDARGTLPKRVVLHKRTPFLRDEREGLRDGMSGVECLEMVEIQIDHALRYVASARRPNGTFDEDNYPVRRGTVMKLDDFTALLWTHGATSALRPGLRYYQGKDVFRHHSRSDGTPVLRRCRNLQAKSSVCPRWTGIPLISTESFRRLCNRPTKSPRSAPCCSALVRNPMITVCSCRNSCSRVQKPAYCHLALLGF